MTQFINNAQDSETSSQYASMRRSELTSQYWNRDKSADLAHNEGISLSDEHWAVIVYLRRYYLEQGLPRFARTTARALNQRFAAEGGNKYLYSLFSGGRYPGQSPRQPAHTRKRHRRLVWYQLLNHSAQKAPQGMPESRREDSDREAIERGEDDGLSVPQSEIPSVHERGCPDAATER